MLFILRVYPNFDIAVKHQLSKQNGGLIFLNLMYTLIIFHWSLHQAVDEFFSKMESQKLDMKVLHQVCIDI